MDSNIRGIIQSYNPSLLAKLDSALELRVTNFERDLFPSLKEVDLAIPGAGFQFVIWVKHEAKFPFPGWDFDAIARPMKYIPTYLASDIKFYNIARAVARDSGGHVEECLKLFCSRLNPPVRGYERLPLGTLARKSMVIDSLGISLAIQLSEYADVLVNPAKHNYGPGSPLPVISFPDALGGYFASRILGSQVLGRGGVLEQYVEAIKKAYSERIVYSFPECGDPGDDPEAWPLQSDLSEPEDNCEDARYRY
jgi:hypothetical protein